MRKGRRPEGAAAFELPLGGYDVNTLTERLGHWVGFFI